METQSELPTLRKRQIRERNNSMSDERLLPAHEVSLNAAETLDDGLLVFSAQGEAHQVDELIRRGADIETRDENKRTPLMLAAARDADDVHAPEVIKVLLAAGADVDAADGRRETALHLACARGGVDVVQALLEAEPMLDARNRQGQTPLMKPLMAASRAAAGGAGRLGGGGGGGNGGPAGTKSLAALTARQRKIARALLSAGAGVWTMNRTGRTLMQTLCAGGGRLFDRLGRNLRTELLIKDCFQQPPEIESIVFHGYLKTLKLDLLKYIGFATYSNEENPLTTILSIEVAMRRRARHSFMLRENLRELADFFSDLALQCMDTVLTEDLDLALKVVGVDKTVAQEWAFGTDPLAWFPEEDNPFEDGPLMAAIEHDLAAPFTCPVVQEALHCVWRGSLDYWDRSKCSFLLIRQDNWKCPWTFQLYRKIPILFTVVEAISYMSTLALTLYIILSDWELDFFTWHEIILICLVIGYISNEAIQLYSWGFKEYITSLWSIVDIIVLVIFATWFLFEVLCPGSNVGYHILTTNAVFMLFRLLHFAAMTAELFGTLVAAIVDMLQDIMRFMILYLAVLVAFAVVLHAQFDQAVGFRTFPGSLLSLFSVSIGCYFDFTVFDGYENHGWACTLVVAFMIFASVILLNLLIALLCDAYYNINANKISTWSLMRAKFIAERTFVWYFPPPLNVISIIQFCISKVVDFVLPEGSLQNLIYQIMSWTILSIDIIITSVMVLPLVSLLDSTLFFGFGSMSDVSDVVENRIMAPWLRPIDRVVNPFVFILFRPVFYYCFCLYQCFRSIQHPFSQEVNPNGTPTPIFSARRKSLPGGIPSLNGGGGGSRERHESLPATSRPSPLGSARSEGRPGAPGWGEEEDRPRARSASPPPYNSLRVETPPPPPADRPGGAGWELLLQPVQEALDEEMRARAEARAREAERRAGPADAADAGAWSPVAPRRGGHGEGGGGGGGPPGGGGGPPGGEDAGPAAAAAAAAGQAVLRELRGLGRQVAALERRVAALGGGGVGAGAGAQEEEGGAGSEGADDGYCSRG